MLLRFLAIVLVLVMSVSQALADRRVALVVANENYQASRLSNPINDSKIIAPALERIGFDVTTVTDIANISGFASTIRAFTEKAEGADIALFYYAGHGFAVNNTNDVGSTNYLMTTSAELSSDDELVLKSGGIALDDVVQKVSRVAKVALFFIDACRNDPYEGTRSTAGTRSLGRIDQTSNEVFIVSSTRLGTTASDNRNEVGTPFAHSLALHIQEPSLRVEDIVSRVRRDVEKATNSAQSPEIVKHDLDEPLVLVASVDNMSLPEQPVIAELPTVAVEEPAYDPAELAMLVQQELERAGCRPGGTDGQWGRRSVAAAELFVTERSLRLATRAPSEELLLALRDTTGRVCSEPKTTVEVAECQDGQKRNSKGICYTPAEPTKKAATKKAVTKKATTKPSTGATTVTARPRTNCFEFNGETFCE